MLNFKSVKTQLIIFLTCFALFLSVKDKDFMFLFTTMVAVISAITIESLALYFKENKFQVSESAIISGLIIGYVISQDAGWQKFVFASSLAISSKYLLRVKGRHIFNPAAFGIFMAIMLFGAQTQWKGTYLWVILAPAGIYFSYKIRKIEITIGYFTASLVLFGVQAVLQKIPLWHIFGYFSYFYVFIMIIEPKTTPFHRLSKYIFGVGIATVIFILITIGVRFDVEIFSLLVMNAAVYFLSQRKTKPDWVKGGVS